MKNIQKFILLICLLLFSISVINAQQISVEGQNLVNTGSLVLGGNMSLNIDGNFNSKGGSTIVFKGNASQKISGGVTASFNDITINNSSTGVVLQRDISLSGDLTMTDGDLDVLDHTLSLGLNGDIVGENVNSMIKSSSGSGNYSTGTDAGDGVISRTVTISTSGISNAGGLGISATPSTNWGTCTVSRKHQRVVGYQGDNSIFRTYTISPTNAANLKANITLKYDAAELNGNNSGSLKVYQLEDHGAKGVEWVELISSDNGSEVTATTEDNTLSELTITLAGTAETLPISLIDFRTNCQNNSVMLHWTTATEVNNDYFIIEKSIDGLNYIELARVSGNGNTNSIINYEFLDYSALSDLVYYRLSQVDYDGKTTIFNPISSSCGSRHILSFTVVNPAQDYLRVYASDPLNSEVEMSCIDVSGRLIFQKKLHSNESHWVVPIHQLSQGLYYLRFISANHIQSKPITILK